MSRHEEKARAIARLWGTDFYLTSNAIATALREEHDRTTREVVERCAGVCEARAAEWRDRVATLSTAKYAADEAADCAFVLRSLLPTEDGNG